MLLISDNVIKEIDMEEKIQYYENSLIPIFKKKLYEAQVIIPELEANILFLRNRVSQLEAENSKLKVVSENSDTYQ